MNHKYWASHFAERHQDQMIQIPHEYKINEVFLLGMDEDEIRDTFDSIHELCFQIQGDIVKSPEEYGMPLYSKAEYRNFSQQCRDSEQATFRPFVLLYHLFICSEIKDQSVIVSIEKYKNLKPRSTNSRIFSEKIANIQYLFKRLSDYGFVFEGLKNNKPTDKNIIISYPDNTLLLHLWKTIANKAENINRLIDFLHCSFRLLQDDMVTKNYSDFENFVDTFPLESEKRFIYEMDKVLLESGMVRGESGYYYSNEKALTQKTPCLFRLININSYNPWHSDIKSEKLEVGLRIRNVNKCMEYLQGCPDSVKQIFNNVNDNGCQRRTEGSCKHGVSYVMNGQTYWRCACCDPAIRFGQPKVEDIGHYINLVELGSKKIGGKSYDHI